jgi:hypothetical protein
MLPTQSSPATGSESEPEGHRYPAFHDYYTTDHLPKQPKIGETYRRPLGVVDDEGWKSYRFYCGTMNQVYWHHKKSRITTLYDPAEVPYGNLAWGYSARTDSSKFRQQIDKENGGAFCEYIIISPLAGPPPGLFVVDHKRRWIRTEAEIGAELVYWNVPGILADDLAFRKLWYNTTNQHRQNAKTSREDAAERWTERYRFWIIACQHRVAGHLCDSGLGLVGRDRPYLISVPPY